MLVNFFTAVFTVPQTVGLLTSVLGNNIPIETCLEFDSVKSKFVFCIDASIDIGQICGDNGISFEHAHNLDVPIENYSKTHFVGVNFTNPPQYYLFEPIECPAVNINLPLINPNV